MGDNGREPKRHFRASDELWEAAQEAVRWNRDPSVSYILREALAQYVRATERRRRQSSAATRGANLERSTNPPAYRTPPRRRPPT